MDIVTFPFAQNHISLAYLNANNSIAKDVGSVDSGLTPVNPAPLPATVPYRHLGATSGGGNSSTIYVYYQVNDTHFAEVSFDDENGVWSPQPVFIPVS